MEGPFFLSVHDHTLSGIMNAENGKHTALAFLRKINNLNLTDLKLGGNNAPVTEGKLSDQIQL